METMNLNQWMETFEANKHSADPEMAKQLGFQSWMCHSKSLMNRIRSMVPVLRLVAKSGKVDPENTSVVFNNHSETPSGTYDTFTLLDENGNTLYTVRATATKEHPAEIYQGTELVLSGSRQEIRSFFRAPKKQEETPAQEEAAPEATEETTEVVEESQAAPTEENIVVESVEN